MDASLFNKYIHKNISDVKTRRIRTFSLSKFLTNALKIYETLGITPQKWRWNTLA